MAENCMTAGMIDTSVKDLIETLNDQQELLQQLYSELDMEREATATATNESLSMILRLQGEKAAVEMEAKQYKRIAEQKMFHAEETVEVFRDVIYQKEMQIASLEFQVQAYRFKLMSLGCNDESMYPENTLLRTNGVRRVCSLPPYLFKGGEEPLTDGEECETSVKVLLEMDDEQIGPAKSGDFTPYWEKIRRLDERVKRFSNSSDVSDTGNKLNEEVCELLMDIEPCKDHVTAVKVQDIFEVPQTPNDQIAELPPAKLSIEDEFYPVTPDANKAVISDDIDKKNWDRRVTMSPDIDKTFPKPRDGLTIEHMYLKRPDVTDLELQQMNKRLKRLEDERIIVRQEITIEKKDEKLLLDIKDQLNSIEHEIKRWNSKKAPPKKEVDISALTEAMLHFW